MQGGHIIHISRCVAPFVEYSGYGALQVCGAGLPLWSPGTASSTEARACPTLWRPVGAGDVGPTLSLPPFS